MSSWTIGKRLVIGFSIVLAITVALGGFAYVELAAIDQSATIITDDSLPGVYNITQIESAARESYALTLQHLVTNDAQQMSALEAAMEAQAARIKSLSTAYEGTITRARDREIFGAIAQPGAEFLRARAETVLPLSRAGTKPEALHQFYQAMKPSYDRYIAAIRASVDDNKEFGDRNGAEIRRETRLANVGIATGLAAALLAGVGVAFLIVRGTNGVLRVAVGELSEGSRQVASASEQVAGASQTLSQGATEQAASLEETSASIEEMASMTRQNAANTQQAAAEMAETERLVHTANGALGDMVASMTAIKSSSDQVSKIIKTIDEIAFQTNILALNAAVEAARAGEAGMGFAVVADEVRALAQRSAQAAKDTAGLIEESITRSNEGYRTVEQVTESIQAITVSTTKVKGLVDEVSLASAQQAQGISQVSQAISQMEKVTQGTAATAEESAAASEELNAQAESSMDIVSRLAALVGGEGLVPPPSASPARGARRSSTANLKPRAVW